MSNNDDLENMEIQEPKNDTGKKDVKTSIGILTSVRDLLYYNKGAGVSYNDFIKECVIYYLKARDQEDATPKNKKRES